MLDIFVTNDAMENHYFENTGKGVFVEEGHRLGVAYGENGQGVSSMGPVVGRLQPRRAAGHLHSEPELLHLCFTQTLERPAQFRRSDGDQRAFPGHGPVRGLGRGAFDYDNDGWLDFSPRTATRITSTCRRTR